MVAKGRPGRPVGGVELRRRRRPVPRFQLILHHSIRANRLDFPLLRIKVPSVPIALHIFIYQRSIMETSASARDLDF